MTQPTPVPPPQHQITITRVFDAPRELVFKAWTEPDQISQWFGPAEIETPRESVDIDLRVGGQLNLRMVQPGSGTEYRLRYEIIGLVEPELLVLRSEPMPEVGMHHATVTRIKLEQEGRKTRMTLTDGPYPDEGGGGAGAGWQSSFDKLAVVLASSS